MNFPTGRLDAQAVEADMFFMEFLFFVLGSLMTYVGSVLLYGSYKSSSDSFSRNGQVVGFSTGPLGSPVVPTRGCSDLRTVIRFVAVDGQECFLMETVGSDRPAYFMGEFVPLLLSMARKSEVYFKTRSDRRLGLFWFWLGVLFWFMYFAQTDESFGGALLNALVFLGLCSVLSSALETQGWNWKKLINDGQDLGSLAPPLVVALDQSHRIPWAQSELVLTPMPQEDRVRRPWFLQTSLFVGALGCFAAAGFYHYQTEQFFKGALPARGVIAYTKTRPYLAFFKVQVPVARYYGPRKNIVEFEDAIGFPTAQFKPGQHVRVFYSRRNPRIARVDLGPWNQWMCYAYFLAGTILILATRKAVLQAQKERTRKPSPIYVRRAS
ncbi:MAG: DUF3592 domain-containing protein [Bdellovibrionales bacterium]